MLRFREITVFDVALSQNDKHFHKFVKELDKGDFLFLKILQNVPNFYNFFYLKKQVESCLIISSYLNRKKQKIRRSSS